MTRKQIDQKLCAMEIAWLNQHRRTRIGMCKLFDELHELLETCDWDDERENND
jgi:hypothetical protein